MIRKLKEEDLSQVAAIEKATQTVPWTDKTFKDCFFAGYPGWVMEEENLVVCFSLISMQSEECHLLNLGVLPRCQRKGLGHQMLSHVIHSSKLLGARMIYLEVRESNIKAIALYEKMNFSQIGMRKDYYPALKGRENGLVYILKL